MPQNKSISDLLLDESMGLRYTARTDFEEKRTPVAEILEQYVSEKAPKMAYINGIAFRLRESEIGVEGDRRARAVLELYFTHWQPAGLDTNFGYRINLHDSMRALRTRIAELGVLVEVDNVFAERADLLGEKGDYIFIYEKPSL